MNLKTFAVICFAVFILTKHFCKSSNTCGSSTHFANIWHADKTDVVNAPFEKKHLLNDFFNLLYLKLWSEIFLKQDLLVVRNTNWVFFHNLLSLMPQSLDLPNNIPSFYFWCKIQVLLYIQMNNASHTSYDTPTDPTTLSNNV